MTDITLSPREAQVVELLVQGLSYKEVACTLGISIRTVDCYLYRVRLKTRQTTLLSAVAFAISRGLVLVNSA